MTDATGIAFPNAVDIHVASESGLLLVSGLTGTVITVNLGALTVKVNTDRDQERPAFVEGAHYKIGGQLSGKGEFTVPKAVFQGYGMGPEDHVASFTGQIGAPQ